ncbi:MAG: NAD-dependent epimerase/dehydratase family protein [Nocardioidaceae bacterium]
MAPIGSVAITGAEGFLGWHLRCRLKAFRPGLDVRPVGRDQFGDDVSLSRHLKGVDAVVHLAGANRGADDEVYDTNVEIARRLVLALGESSTSPQVVYANTIQAERDTAYGRSKQEAAQILSTWGKEVGAPVTDLRLPNLFGECGKPNYNSAVATFCHELAAGTSSHVNLDGKTELLHAQDACATLVEQLDAPEGDSRRVNGREISIPEVYHRLQRLGRDYGGAFMPSLLDHFDLQLFNALRTAMFPAYYPIRLDNHRDSRGSFFEIARGHGKTQTSFSTTKPGVSRGEHYHFEKIERFVVLHGSADIELRRLFTDDVVSFAVSSDEPVAVDMPPLYAHNITNTADADLLTMFWANDHFDAASSDTFPEPVRLTSSETAR